MVLRVYHLTFLRVLPQLPYVRDSDHRMTLQEWWFFIQTQVHIKGLGHRREEGICPPLCPDSSFHLPDGTIQDVVDHSENQRSLRRIITII